ncbi:MAG: DUF2752 domain-containing protein [Bacteroidetes bacterium]|nr:DUF2752 domain-containing protein [Bacteroidota bacterium]
MSKKNLYTFLLLLSLAGYIWIAWNVVDNSKKKHTADFCLFKTVTHIPCPSCGTTRALVLLVNGQIQKSILTNPFGMLAALALVIIPLWIILDIIRNKESFLKYYKLTEQIIIKNKWISITAVTIVLLNWIWNIAKGL